jgi:CRP/FNR family transcriptional regulator
MSGPLPRPGARPPGAALDDPEVAAAVRLSFLRRVPAASLVRLLDDALDVVVPAGGVIHPEGGPPFAMLVVSGLVRIVASSPDGRQATIRYARSGAQLGFGSLFSVLPNVVAAVALRDTRVVALRPGRAHELATTDPAIAAALLAELSDRIIAYQGELVGSTFSGLRQKVARHLLDIAQPARGAGPLVAHISQAALADAVGTSREVVVRVLRDLRVAGLVETGRDGVVLLAPERLHEESWPTTP